MDMEEEEFAMALSVWISYMVLYSGIWYPAE